MHFAGGHENKEGLLPAIREAELEASVQGIDGDREFPHDEAPHPCQLQLFLKIKASKSYEFNLFNLYIFFQSKYGLQHWSN